MKSVIRKIGAGTVVVGLLVGAGMWYFRGEKKSTAVLRTAELSRGDIQMTINATGTVEPEEVINVGAQVAGRILSFGTDAAGKLVDYGSPVEECTVLAQIDDSLYKADLDQAMAQVQSAKANVQRSQADLDQLKAKQYQAERDWQRAQKLGPSDALSQTSYDQYQSSFETAKANMAVGEAAVLQSQAGVVQAEALLVRAKRNLDYCTIQSPVRGVIIDRRVNIGQTVVSSLNAPSLFLIAKDLKRMQVWVAVNEADIGKIRTGLPVRFTVDAFPGEVFRGEVGKIRLNASMTQNVVTYTVEILTDNSSGRLLPYLTANVRFELEERKDVLLASNSALRWQPTFEQILPEYRAEYDAAGVGEKANGGGDASIGGGRRQHGGDSEGNKESGRGMDAQGGAVGSDEKKVKDKDGSKDKGDSKDDRGARSDRSRGVVWVAEGNYVRPVKVKVGLSDDVNTEVSGEGLKEGMMLVVGIQTPEEASAGTTNPFTPNLMRRAAGGGGRSR